MEEHVHITDVSKYINPLRIKEFYIKDTSGRIYFMEDLAEAQKYYEKTFTWDLEKLMNQIKQTERSFSDEAVKFFSKKRHTAEDVLAYFEALPQSIQKEIKFGLITTDANVAKSELIPYLRYYLKHTNRRAWKLERFSAERLTKSLSKIPSLKKRAEFIDDLLDFKPESLALRKEIKQAEKTVGKQIIDRSSIKLSGTFMAIGTILIAGTIVGLSAQNNFTDTALACNPVEIITKMSIGEPLSLNEMYAYTIRNEDQLEANPEKIVDIFEFLRNINNYLDELPIDLQDDQEPSAEIQQDKVIDTLNTNINNFNLNNVVGKTGTLET